MSVLLLTSCGGDDCLASDWAGTYILRDDGTCEPASVSILEQFIILEGATDLEININGRFTTIDAENCSVTDGFTLEKSGNTLSVDFGSGCLVRWSKQ